MSNITVSQANSIVLKMKDEFAKVLPKILTPDRYCRVLLTAINKNPTLGDALADPRNKASVLSAFMRCAESGLEPDGRRAVINCFKRGNTGMYDVTFIPMFQGLSELAMRSGLISNIHADKVCENDYFDWNTGEITHKIDYKNPRGKVYAYYCIVKFKDGSTKTETMSLDEVNEVRDNSSAYKAAAKYGKDTPWTTHPEEMGKKTVFRRCAKWLPLSPEQKTAIESDDDDYRYNNIGAEIIQDRFAQETGVEPKNEAENNDVEDAEIVPEEKPQSENLFAGEEK
jgi:recombination protein RecT